LLGVGREQYCRYAWSKVINSTKQSKAPSAWQAIGKRQSGKPVTSLVDFKLQAEGYLKQEGRRVCSLDVFLSPNQFFDWRNTKQLSLLHANWIDIDTVEHAILSLQEQEQIIAQVLQIIDETELPAPTGFVTSGSGGLHLYWIYQGIPAYKSNVALWRELATSLSKSLRDKRPESASWVVDFKASHDPARVMRLPGTFHSGSGRQVQAYVGGRLYEFHQLAALLLGSEKVIEACQSQNQVVRELKISPTKKSAHKIPDKSPGKHTIGQWWFRVYTQICTHARRNGVSLGQRDYYAFMLYVALRHIKPTKEEALATVSELNKEFIHLTDDELKAYLKTAHQKGYKYRKDTLAEYLESNLGISSGFLYLNMPRPLSANEIKSRQQNAAKQTAEKRCDRTLASLKAAMQKLVEARLKATQEAIASLANRSVRTVRRYWRELLNEMRTFAPSLYIPAPEVLSSCL